VVLSDSGRLEQINNRELAAATRPPLLAMIICRVPMAPPDGSARLEGPLYEALQTKNAPFEPFGF
jgi:hypothetical protein